MGTDIISDEIELFLKSRENQINFSQESYIEKYKKIISEQSIIETAYQFDERIISLKRTYDKSHKFTKRTSELLLCYLDEYNNFPKELREKIKTTMVLEELRVLNNEYYSPDAVERRRQQMIQRIISWSFFIVYAVAALVGIILIFVTDHSLGEISEIGVIAITVLLTVVISLLTHKVVKNRWLYAGCVVMVLLVAIIINLVRNKIL